MRDRLYRASLCLIVAGGLWWAVARWLEFVGGGLPALPARRVWSLPAGPLRTFFSPDGKWVLWLDIDGLNISSTDRPAPRQLVADPGLAGQSGRASPVLFLPDNQRVLAPVRGHLKLLRLDTGRCERDIPLDDTGVKTPEGIARWLYEGLTPTFTGSVEPLELSSGPDRNQTDLTVLDLSPDGRRAAFWTIYPRPALAVLDIASGRVLWRLPHTRPARVRFTAGSDILLVGGNYLGIGFRDAANGAPLPTPAGCIDPVLEAWSLADDRGRIALLHNDRTISFVRTDGKPARPTLPLGRAVFWNCRWYSESDLLVVEGQLPDRDGAGMTGLVLRELDDTPREVHLVAPESVVLGVSPRGDYGVVRVGRSQEMADAIPIVGNVHSGQEWRIPVPLVRSVAFDRGGRFVAFGSPANLSLYARELR